MLHIHRAERADGLVEALRELLAEPPADPFAPELVAVPTRGMERWLAQRLSSVLGRTPGRGDGICANVEFPAPGRLLADAVAVGTGVSPDDDPWRAERLVWPLLDVVEASLAEPCLRTLADHIGGPDPASADPVRRARRLAVVRKLAGLFDAYGRDRPDMIRAWAAGTDAGPDGAPLAEDVLWQARLWAGVRRRIATPSPAERLSPACERLRAAPETLDLPDRLAVFNLTRLPAADVEVLAALAEHRDVHLFVLHPSPALWHRIAQAPAPASPRRREDPTAEAPRHPLLASWGTDARELQLVIASATEHTADDHRELPDDGRDESLLSRIQDDIRSDRAPSTAALDPTDDSIRVHACHGRGRQVEVLRDALLHLLEDDATLEPRDIVVLCPDIEAFAPLIHAAFGAGEIVDEEVDDLPEDVRPPDLRVRLADRALRQINPVLDVVADLLELASERVTASQVLDLADREPVRRRFGFDDDSLQRLRGWTADSGIRWGLDAAHRETFQLAAVRENTWQFGLDRLLLGVAMTEEGHRRFGGVLPVDDVGSGDIELAGRFAELLDRLHAAVEALHTPRGLSEWAALLAGIADQLMATSPRDAWQREGLTRLLDGLATEAQDGSTPISLPELRALLDDRLQGRPTRANFRTGGLTICTMHPMRSVPHRVVCVLGLDDGAFPRRGTRDGDDLTAAEPHLGDRDPRTEDRQLLLDALLSATERFIVTYTGRDERTNARKPPAVPVGELLDVVDATAGDGAREQVVVEHPLQPFDPRNFAAGALAGDGSWAFDRVMLAGAERISAPRDPAPPFLDAPLPAAPADHVELSDLVRFAQHPVKAFLRQRLGVSLTDYDTEVEDAVPIDLNALEEWGVGDRLVRALLAGTEPRTATLAEIARGTLPPGEQLAMPVINAVFPRAERIATAAADAGGGPFESVDVRIDLGDGRTLGGGITNVGPHLLRTVTYSRLGAKQRLCAWVQLVALTAAFPHRPFEAVTIGRGRGNRIAVARIRSLAPDPETRRRVALDELRVLLDLHARGLRSPLPLPCKTAAAFAQALHSRGNPVRDAAKEWKSDFDYPKEDREPEHRLAFGGVLTLDELLAIPPEPDEAGEGWRDEERSRLGRCAWRLWGGLLAHEEIVER